MSPSLGGETVVSLDFDDLEKNVLLVLESLGPGVKGLLISILKMPASRVTNLCLKLALRKL